MPACSLRPPVRRVVARVFCASWAVLLLAVPAARGDIQEPINAHNPGQRLQRRSQARETGPANGLAQQVRIRQGESIDIILTGRGQPGRTIEFIVRTPPTHGTLEGPPQQLTRETARVTYVHRAGDGPGIDAFTYAVQGGNSAVSAPVPVSIEILDQPPQIVASPAELDFGAVKVDESTHATLTLENRGGGTAVGRLDPPAPWVVEGDNQYQIARGETRSFQITFRPPYGESYVETMRFQAGGDAPGVRLIGSGIGPHNPSEDVARTGRTVNAAEAIARDNALARAAENAALAPADAASGAPASPVAADRRPATAAASVAGNSVPADGGAPSSARNTTTTAAAASAPAANDLAGPVGNGGLNLPPGGADSVVLNEAAVTRVDVRSVGTTTLALIWTAPRPTPKSYRVELRYLELDSDDNLRVDWRPYAKVDIQTNPASPEVTARVYSLPSGTRQTVRIVAVDDAGRLAAPSPMLVVATGASATWWHVTPLKVLVFLLLVCGGLMIYRKWEDQQIIRSIDESRAARRGEVMQFRS